ncbi:helix-turn-helix domain-containing protein [Arsenophonus nasoniae]|uniref:Helix-turn-helix domain protein n=1 Tax=Arsenophonus nasoniae TaxID=638 RepID=A0A4V1BWE7_9GAMM|nr:helix-turn-helix domain-containing protein [Arsenophonus nasoniae]QBY41933.1 Helix-turn-helix domain protein [Arsenophonus nasoniae]WGM06138.1 helix-turn-helix domain-containing protein [Arsenophonus nasoniae]WGM11100.1 helix-turn-helix domain-containing protein [Arsenophonus nasoniae]WGM15801.1 helix-turn-helix domain-containing protein [Arsenophonus nasoniae]
MSRIATNWVWKINLKASQKLLLLALADRADEHHCCYPSIQRLSNDTGLDRKTICRQINKMIAEGLIIDTGERKGVTKQVKVLRLNIELEHTQKRNSTEIGNDPKNGTLKDPKNGTQNLSVEPNIESKDLNTQNPIEKNTIKISRYAFEGEVIRLNQKDFEQWASIFSDIDLLQELKRFDFEFSKEKPKNWFSALSAKLNYQNETARKRKQQRQPVTNQSTMTIAKNGLVFF